MRFRLLGSFLILILAFFLQFYFGDSVGIWINFVLAALISAAFFVSFPELLVLILAAILVLNWQPVFSFELLIFALIPVVSFYFHKLISLRWWLSTPAMIFPGVVALYLFFGEQFFFLDRKVFAEDLLLSAAAGLFFSGVLRFLAARETYKRASGVFRRRIA